MPRYRVRWGNTSPIGDHGKTMPSLADARRSSASNLAGRCAPTEHDTLECARRGLREKFEITCAALRHYTPEPLRFAICKASVDHAEPGQMFGGAHLWCWIEEIDDA